jgi:acetoin utilization protein AcuB
MFPISTLADVTTFNPWSITADMDLTDLLPLLDEGWLHHWPVVDAEQRVVGVISDDDLVRVLIENRTAKEAVASGVPGPADPPRTPVHRFMSYRWVAVGPDESPRRALKLLLQREVRCLPVVQDDRLAGVVTAGDFLRELAYSDSSLAGEPVSRFVQADEETIEANATLEEAKLAMESAGKNSITVERGAVPLGVVSLRDLRLAKLRRMAKELTAGDELDAGPARLVNLVAESPSLRPGQPLREAAGLLAERNLQAVAVVNQAHRLVGVLTEDDLLRALLEA